MTEEQIRATIREAVADGLKERGACTVFQPAEIEALAAFARALAISRKAALVTLVGAGIMAALGLAGAGIVAKVKGWIQ